MPDLSIESYYWCSQNENAVFDIKGSSSIYRVTFSNGTWYCPCKGFKFRKTCSHVKQAVSLKCDHGVEAAAGSPTNDWNEDGSCPKCGSESSVVRIAV